MPLSKHVENIRLHKTTYKVLQVLQYHVTETLTSESDTNYCSMVSQQLL